jgi:hypothetical protein
MFSSYDDWKLMSPEDKRPLWDDENYDCPFCGARAGQACLLEEVMGDDLPCARPEERDPDAERQQAEDDRMDREQDR